MTADPATADPKRAADDLRLRQAMRLAGGAAGETRVGLPRSRPCRGAAAARPHGHLGPRPTSGKAAEQLLRQAVFAIRLWQPEVVVTDAAAADAAPADVLVLHAAKEAFKKAADPASFPEQIDVLGLKPWAAKKLYALGAVKGTGTFSAAEKVPVPYRTRRLPGDARPDRVRHYSRRLAEGLRRGRRPPAGLPRGPRSAASSSSSHRLPGAESHASLMQGIDLAHGGAARREARAARSTPRGWPSGRRRRRTAATSKGWRPRRTWSWPAPRRRWRLSAKRPRPCPTTRPRARPTRSPPAMSPSAAGPRRGRRMPCSSTATPATRWPSRRSAGCWPTTPAASRAAAPSCRSKLCYQHAAFQPHGGKAVIPASASGVRNQSSNGMTEDRFRIEEAEAAPRWHTPCLQLEPKLAAFGPRLLPRPGGVALPAGGAAQPRPARGGREVRGRLLQGQPAGRGRAAGRGRVPGLPGGRDADVEPGGGAGAAEAGRPVPAHRTSGRSSTAGSTTAAGRRSPPLPLKPAARGQGVRRGVQDGGVVRLRRAVPVRRRALRPPGRAAGAAGGEAGPRRGPAPAATAWTSCWTWTATTRRTTASRSTTAAAWPRTAGATAPGTRSTSSASTRPRAGWTAELAIPLAELTGDRPSHGRAWAVNVTRVVPGQGVQSWSGPAGSRAAAGGDGPACSSGRRSEGAGTTPPPETIRRPRRVKRGSFQGA